uniref:Uncharacterized protein n=1 Tax=Anopheles christyi TaxID=43041 RepID=A0A182KHN9_9DIPT
MNECHSKKGLNFPFPHFLEQLVWNCLLRQMKLNKEMRVRPDRTRGVTRTCAHRYSSLATRPIGSDSGLLGNVLLQMFLVVENSAIPLGHRSLLANPNLLRHLVNQPEVVANEHQSTLEVIDSFR